MMFPFKVSLVDNWKKLLTKSAVMWMVYLGTAAEVLLSFTDIELGLLPRLGFLALIGGGRLVQQHLATKDLQDDEPIGI